MRLGYHSYSVKNVKRNKIFDSYWKLYFPVYSLVKRSSQKNILVVKAGVLTKAGNIFHIFQMPTLIVAF